MSSWKLRFSLRFSSFIRAYLAKNGTVPLWDRFCRENGLPSVLKRKEKDDFYDMGERSGTVACKQGLIINFPALLMNRKSFFFHFFLVAMTSTGTVPFTQAMIYRQYLALATPDMHQEQTNYHRIWSADNSKVYMYDRVNSRSPVSHTSLLLRRAENYILSFGKHLAVVFTYRYGISRMVGFTVLYILEYSTCQALVGIYYTSTYTSIRPSRLK